MVDSSPTRSMVSRPLVLFLSAGLGVGLTVLVYELRLPALFREAIPIAEALSETKDAVWPPAPSAPPQRVPDAGVEPREPLPQLPEPRPGLEARAGRYHDLYYIEAVFGDAPFDDPMPVVVVLHGRGGRALLPGGPFFGLKHPVRVLVPQAPEPLGEGYQWLPVRVGSGLVDRLSSSLVATAGQLARFLRDSGRRQPREGRTIVTGFSQGGLVTLALALYHDDVVGEALPLAGWLPPPLQPTYRRDDIVYPPIRAMHGTADRIVPIEPTRELVDRLRELTFDVELAEFEGVEHETTEPMNALFHHWLDAAVCRAVKDAACALAADNEARALQGLTPIDAGVASEDAGDWDGSAGDASPGASDAALDAAATDAAVLDAAATDAAATDAAGGPALPARDLSLGT